MNFERENKDVVLLFWPLLTLCKTAVADMHRVFCTVFYRRKACPVTMVVKLKEIAKTCSQSSAEKSQMGVLPKFIYSYTTRHFLEEVLKKNYWGIFVVTFQISI